MTRSKVKVTRPLKLEILWFSKSISFPIFNVSWQMTTDSETTEQYLTFVRSRFLISVLAFVSRDFELGRVSVQFMLLQLQLYSLGGGGVQRWPSVPYGANFVPRVSTKLGERAFSYAGPVVWHNLPVYIRAEPDIALFKNTLKTYFLDSRLIY